MRRRGDAALGRAEAIPTSSEKEDGSGCPAALEPAARRRSAAKRETIVVDYFLLIVIALLARSTWQPSLPPTVRGVLLYLTARRGSGGAEKCGGALASPSFIVDFRDGLSLFQVAEARSELRE